MLTVPLHSNSAASSFRELRRANGQSNRDISKLSSNSVNHHPHEYSSFSLVSNISPENVQEYGHLNVDESSRSESSSDPQTSDTSIQPVTETDGYVDSLKYDFLNQIQLAVLRKLEAQLMNELNQQQEKQQKQQQQQQDTGKVSHDVFTSQDNVGEYTSDARNDASDNLLYGFNDETSMKKSNPPSMNDNERVSPHESSSPVDMASIYSYNARNQVDDTSPTGSDDYSRISGTNIYLDPHQFAQLIASNGDVSSRGVNFIRNSLTKSLGTNTNTLMDMLDETEKNSDLSISLPDDKSIKVEQDVLKQQQQQQPSTDSRSINTPTDVDRHEPSSVFSQRNVQRIPSKQSNPQVASSLLSSSSRDDIRNLIARLTATDLFNPSHTDNIDQLVSPSGQMVNNKSKTKSNSVVSELRVPGITSSFGVKRSSLQSNGQSDDDTFSVVDTFDNDQDTRDQLLPSQQNELFTSPQENQLFYPNSLDSESRVGEVNPPGYFSLDDYNAYFSNILGNSMASNSPSHSLKSDDEDVTGDEDNELVELLHYLRGTDETDDDGAIDDESYISTAIGVEGTPGFTLSDLPGDSLSQAVSRKTDTFTGPLSDAPVPSSVDNSDSQDFYLTDAIDRLFAAGSNSVKRNQVEEIKRLFTGSKRVDIKKPGPKLDWVRRVIFFLFSPLTSFQWPLTHVFSLLCLYYVA